MRLFGYPYNDLVMCKDSPDYLMFNELLIIFEIRNITQWAIYSLEHQLKRTTWNKTFTMSHDLSNIKKSSSLPKFKLSLLNKF